MDLVKTHGDGPELSGGFMRALVQSVMTCIPFDLATLSLNNAFYVLQTRF